MGRYLSFISYRHRERELRISALLRRELETHALPKNDAVPRSRRVFRDTDELPTSSDLGKDIENALADSDWLIALCSEEYKESRWCLREIDEYIALGKKDRILPVLTGGGDDILPEAIRDIPPAADLRGVPARALAGEVKKIVPRLLSRMSGLEESTIAAAQRKRRLLFRLTAFAAVTAAVLGFALYAVRTADVIAGKNEEIAEATRIAEQEQTEAVAQRNDALAKRAAYYAGEAEKSLAEGNEEEAVRQALEAMPENTDGEEPVSARAVNVLRQVMNIPSVPREGYALSFSAECSGELTGVLEHLEDGALLSGAPGSGTAYRIDFGTGELVPAENAAQIEGTEKGFRYGSKIVNTGSRIFYGNGQQMQQQVGELETRNFTLNGEPFYADHIWQSASGNYVLAWLEEPEAGQEPHTALFNTDVPSKLHDTVNHEEALAEIRVSGKILSVSMYGGRLAIVTRDGRLRLFDMNTGDCSAEAEGLWNTAYFASNTGLFAGTREGPGALLDPITLERLFSLESPSPIRQFWYCGQREQILACCADGFRIYKVSDGALVTGVQTEEEPIGAYWGSYDGWIYTHTGNTVLMLYPGKAEVYSVYTKQDEKGSDAVTLYRPGLQERCRSLFFSPDSRYVYTEAFWGSIYKWDAESGELLWRNECEWELQPSKHCGAFISLDGKTVWRGNSYMNGYVAIDAETGETLREITLSEFTHRYNEPEERPDGRRMLAQQEYGNGFSVFDPATGEILWDHEEGGNVFFAEDGQSVHYIRRVKDRKNWKDTFVWQRLDTETGEVLEEIPLLEINPDEDYCYLEVSKQNRQICISGYRYDAPETSVIRVVDMDTRILREYHVDREAAYVNTEYPYSGGSAMRWKEEDLYRVCMLNPDGTTGPVADTESDAGRRMTTGRDEYVVLNDEEYSEGAELSYSIVRLTDGEPLFRTFRSMNVSGTLSPDGKTVGIYANDLAPTLIRLTEDKLLAEKARKWLEGTADD